MRLAQPDLSNRIALGRHARRQRHSHGSLDGGGIQSTGRARLKCRHVQRRAELRQVHAGHAISQGRRFPVEHGGGNQGLTDDELTRHGHGVRGMQGTQWRGAVEVDAHGCVG